MILNFYDCSSDISNGKQINIGDMASAPCHYLDFKQKTELLSLRDVNNDFVSKYDKNAHIIIGGGSVINKMRYENVMIILNYFKGIKVLWGVDMSRNLNAEKTKEVLSNVNLIGVRNTIHFDNYPEFKDKMFLIPCASCLSRGFDKFKSNKPTSQTILYGSTKKIDRLFPKILTEKYGNVKINRGKMKKLNKIIDTLGSSDTIITNSYHGYYWAILLGKKSNVDVVHYPSIVPSNVLYSDDKTRNNYIKQKIDENNKIFFLELKTYGLIYVDNPSLYSNPLEDSRKKNMDFYNKFMQLINY